jgi:hypothetical protein
MRTSPPGRCEQHRVDVIGFEAAGHFPNILLPWARTDAHGVPAFDQSLQSRWFGRPLIWTLCSGAVAAREVKR